MIGQLRNATDHILKGELDPSRLSVHTLLFRTNLEQRRLLLRVFAEFFDFVYGSLLGSGFFAHTLTFGLVALPLLTLLFFLAFVESRSPSRHMVPLLSTIEI